MFKKSKTILTGDFNINLLEHQTHADTNDFLVFMQNLFYLPVISRPTSFPEGACSTVTLGPYLYKFFASCYIGDT